MMLAWLIVVVCALLLLGPIMATTLRGESKEKARRRKADEQKQADRYEMLAKAVRRRPSTSKRDAA